MPSPIENQVGAVFIPVSDMPAAIGWYSRLFGLPVEAATHAGRIYSLPMRGPVAVILDSHRPVANSAQPLCFFWTADIQAAADFLRAKAPGALRGGSEDIGSLFTLTLQDPDGNLLMVCQRKD
jgi:predicted enzyme related to lactoylglutathione lyase